MNLNKFKILSVISLVPAIILSIFMVSTAIAKPVQPNPGNPWPPGTTWGTNLRFENTSTIFISEIWWGVGTSEIKSESPPDPPSGLVVEFLDAAQNSYALWVQQAVAEPASYTWQVQFRKVQALNPDGGTVRSTMENADTGFVPQDYSIVLENTSLGIHINLRAGSDNIKGTNIRTTPITANLYVDNAVNIQSIDNLDPLVGTSGNTLRLRVFVRNTGRYTDNYTVTAGGSLDPTILNLAPDHTDNVIVTTTLPLGTENIIITAAGTYATDQAYITATGVTRGVQAAISPSSQENVNGGTLTYTVTINNTGNVLENFQLTKGDNTGWTTSLDNTWLLVPSGENRSTKLTVTVLANATGGTSDNVWVKAASKDDPSVFDNKSCLAQATIVRGVQVVLSPSSQENVNGGMLKYTVTVNNTGNVQENFQLTKGDNASWTLTLDNTWLLVPKNANGTTKLTVTIPGGAGDNTWDNIWVKAASNDNAAIFDNESCLARSIIVRGVSVSISPSSQGAPPLVTLNYTVNVKNTGSVSDNYLLTVSDNAGWSPSVLPTSLLVSAFSSDNATLSVTIPSGAVGGMVDNIKVEVTSQSDNTLIADNSSIAIAFATSSLNLVNGWNLVGFTLTSENTTPRNVFTGLTYLTDYVIYSWNAPTGPYVLQGVDQPLKDNVGYWVSINVNRTVSTSGAPLDNRDVHLIAGWNLVAFPVVNASTTPNNKFTGLIYITDYIIYYWNAPGGPYTLQSADHPLENDRGYWVWVKANKTVTVP